MKDGSLWRNTSLRALLLAHLTSNLGDWLAFIAIFDLIVLQWRSDVLGITCLTVSYLLPFALVAPVAGVHVDRLELRRLMITSDVLRAGIVCLMLWADDLALLCALVFLHQAVSTFFNPAQHAALPRLVPGRHLLAANALATQASHVTKVLGPGVAGVLVATLGTRGCLLLDAGTFLLSAACLTALPRMHASTAAAPQAGIRADLGQAWAWMRRRPRLLWTLFSLALSIAGLGAFLVALPIHARDALSFGSRGMGLLLSCLGTGTLLGSVAILRRGDHDRLQLLRGAGVLLSAGLAGLAAASDPGVAVVCLVALGVGTALLVVPAQALLQEETPEMLRGRVIGMALALLALSQVAGMGIAAWLGRAQTAAWILIGAAALTVSATLLLVGAGRRPRTRPAADGRSRAAQVEARRGVTCG